MVTHASIRPGLYTGTLRHQRHSPRVHDFRQQLFMVLLDVDRIPELMAASRFTSYNRWNWASFHDADHIGDPQRPLRERLALDASRSGLVLPDGPVYLLTHLRYLGYCFNPVSFYYCYDTTGTLRLMMADVRNTFGGRHTYWVAASAHGPDSFRGEAGKTLYVSPFMPADLDYSFSFSAPADRLSMHISARSRADAGGRVLDATLLLRRQPWTATVIRRALVRHPAMTAGVIARIHVEALRLWWKGLRFVPRGSEATGPGGETVSAGTAKP